MVWSLVTQDGPLAQILLMEGSKIGGSLGGDITTTTSPFQSLKKMTKLSVRYTECMHSFWCLDSLFLSFFLSLSLSLSLSSVSVCLSKIFLDFFHHSFPVVAQSWAAIVQAFRVPQLHFCCINLLFYSQKYICTCHVS